PAPGGQREVGRVAAELNDRSLDREHALCELHVLRGAGGPRLPVLVKLHHAIADGATTVEVWEGLFGADPAAPPSRPPERGAAARPPGPVSTLALAALLAARARMELCGAPWTANYAMGVAPGGVGLHMSFLTHPGQLDVGVHVDRRQGDGGWSIVAALETAID